MGTRTATVFSKIRQVKNVWAVCAILLLAFVGCGDDEPLPTEPVEPKTAAEFTERGWDRFENENFDGALSDFDRARELDPESGEALAGRGWCLTMGSSSPVLMLEAANAFSHAVIAGENETYVLAGRAAALLGAGADYLTDAISEARNAHAADPDFEFIHRTSINSSDLRLVEAIALATQGKFADALSAADPIMPSGIDRTDPVTWSVDEVSHDTFPGVVLAYLDFLSRQFSG